MRKMRVATRRRRNVAWLALSRRLRFCLEWEGQIGKASPQIQIGFFTDVNGDQCWAQDGALRNTSGEDQWVWHDGCYL